MRLFALALTLALVAREAPAAPTDLCESAVERAASKFMACRLDAESKHTRTLDSVKRDEAIAKCVEKFTQACVSAKSRNGAENCTTVPDADLRTYMTDCSDGIEGASGLGGALPTCSGDLLGCSTDLAACTSSLGTCTAGKAACEGSLSSCHSTLGASEGSLSTCSGSLSTCQTSLTSTQGTLATCATDKGACEDDLATAQAGTATAADVLSGKTFASGSGLSSTGSMADRGAVTITPGTTDQEIAAGYHDGSGKVVGDPDLVAGNVVRGVSLFGVTGTAMSNELLRTGQTTSYGAGSDGAVRAGTVQSFTDNGDGTVTDNRTGLVWEKKSDDGSIHDKDDTYTWGQSASPYSMNGTMVTTFLAALNTPPCFAGYCDWRVPNLLELETLRNLDTVSPATFAEFHSGCAPGCSATTCSCTAHAAGGNRYWSSATIGDTPQSSWSV